MYIPNPYTDPAYAAYMAFAFPFQPNLMLPTFVAASASLARASLLPTVCAATAWNMALLGVLAGNECACGKARPAA
jgi:hypothetical protein